MRHNYTEICELCRSEVWIPLPHDGDRGTRPQPAQNPHQLWLWDRDAAVGGVAGIDVQEDRRAAAGDDRRRVVFHDGEETVGGRDPPQRLASPAERRARPAPDMPEEVVARRARILVPPVPADDAVEAEAHAGVGVDPVDDRPELVRAERGGAVALAMVRGDAVAPDSRTPRAEDAPAALRHRQPRGGRAGARHCDPDLLGTALQEERD